MLELIGKLVEVVTPETQYTGKLIEVNENEVYLEGESGWIVIPVETVVIIREPEE